MSTGYTRQSAAEIIPSAVVRSSSFNNELNKIRDAFQFSSDGSTGHTHDGSSDEGSYIPLIADVDANNKLIVDGLTNRISFYNEVSSSPVEQVRFEDGVIYPVTDNDVDLGTSTLKFKRLYTTNITIESGFDTPVNAGDPVTLEYFEDTLSGSSPSLKPLLWLSAGTYVIGEVRLSPVNYLVYESLTNHTGLTTDPSSDATNWVLVTSLASSFTWETKTANYTASDGDRILGDTSGGVFTVTLPASPLNGSEVWFADPGSNWATNNLTVDGNGNNIDGASTFAADVNEGAFVTIYNGTAWVVRLATGVA